MAATRRSSRVKYVGRHHLVDQAPVERCLRARSAPRPMNGAHPSGTAPSTVHDHHADHRPRLTGARTTTAGPYLSDRQRNLRKALVMALATSIGSILPAVPFFFVTSQAVCWTRRDYPACVGRHRPLPGISGHLCDLDSRLGAHDRTVARSCVIA